VWSAHGCKGGTVLNPTCEVQHHHVHDSNDSVSAAPCALQRAGSYNGDARFARMAMLKSVAKLQCYITGAKLTPTSPGV
jgi:hypothetical protein